jgi:hypothetical protein
MPQPKTLTEELTEAVKATKQPPLWKGPAIDGITQSMLCRFMCCRHRFWALVVKGLKPQEKFSPRTEYGNMWHLCEEAHANGEPWKPKLILYSRGLVQQYATAAEEIDQWYRVCALQFPLYLAHWANHPHTKGRTPVAAEKTFSYAYPLPSGRVVRLRGKLDSVDKVAKQLWLQENKTKADPDEQSVTANLQCDFQSQFYLQAMEHLWPGQPIAGIRYNVVRRPLSGGRHTIRRHKATKKKPAETKDAYYKRLTACIESEPEYFFHRFEAKVAAVERERFSHEVLTPLLESLWDWWEWIVEDPDRPFRAGNQLHWRFPYGVWNPTLEGYSSDIDRFINTGSTAGLRRVKTLFNELEP